LKYASVSASRLFLRHGIFTALNTRVTVTYGHPQKSSSQLLFAAVAHARPVFRNQLSRSPTVVITHTSKPARSKRSAHSIDNLYRHLQHVDHIKFLNLQRTGAALFLHCRRIHDQYTLLL
jgi:hypothetical protein